jgi:hypothetical protein
MVRPKGNCVFPFYALPIIQQKTSVQEAEEKTAVDVIRCKLGNAPGRDR